jgi:signal transduction histidine kinase/ABC-type multidrug transport system ATPase subunit
VCGGAATAEPMLRVRGLTVRYGPVVALDGLDLEIRPGEIVALAGENGAGKSTLVRCLAGDIAPDGGEVSIGGRVLRPDPADAVRAGVAVVWQDLALYDNLDVASNLLLGSTRTGLVVSDTRFHQAAAELLRTLDVDLPDTTRNVRTLSGGQRQLLAVARAIRDRPRLLILDEPTSALAANWSGQVEELTSSRRDQGTTVLLVSHDIDQMFRLADRIAVLRHGRIVADLDPAVAHPDDVVALMAGQEVDVSPRRQLDRLHGLVDRLTAADPSSSLPLIVSALGAALGTDEVCIHLLDGRSLRLDVSLGLPPALTRAWTSLDTGAQGGLPGRAAERAVTVVDTDTGTGGAWGRWRPQLLDAGLSSSWAVPITGSTGTIGVITVFRRSTGAPARDELDLVALYAGYAAGAIERDRLLGEVTARNRVLETIRDMLGTLAGPLPLDTALASALQALRIGLGADAVGLADRAADQPPRWRSLIEDEHRRLPTGRRSAEHALAAAPSTDDRVHALPDPDGDALAVGFGTPRGSAVLVAYLRPPADGRDRDVVTALLQDAARSLQLALEREESERSHQEASALRRSQELQQQFLSRLSHELRTPLTAIRGYASSLLQTDVTWDGDSQQRFLTRIAAESARVGRLVDDMLDFSAIESSILRLQPDWCELGLVLEAASGIVGGGGAPVTVSCQAALPVVWADHDRLEQVFINLMDNAVRHNPPGTRVAVEACASGEDVVVVTVADDGGGVSDEVAARPFESGRERRSRTAGAGLGLSIAKGIIDAHGGRLTLEQLPVGTRFRIELPVEHVTGTLETSPGA